MVRTLKSFRECSEHNLAQVSVWGFHWRGAECWIKDVKRCKANKILTCVCPQIGLERALYKILPKLFHSVTEATEQMCLKPKLVKCRASF